jgi:hypothetical protein
MMQTMHAVSCREYSSDYVAAEDAAKAAKRGIWAGAFDIPANWRKERKVLVPKNFVYFAATILSRGTSCLLGAKCDSCVLTHICLGSDATS